MIEFKDNQPVIDLVSKKPRGLLIQLEEQGLLGRRANNRALLQVRVIGCTTAAALFVPRPRLVRRCIVQCCPAPGVGGSGTSIEESNSKAGLIDDIAVMCFFVVVVGANKQAAGGGNALYKAPPRPPVRDVVCKKQKCLHFLAMGYDTVLWDSEALSLLLPPRCAKEQMAHVPCDSSLGAFLFLFACRTTPSGAEHAGRRTVASSLFGHSRMSPGVSKHRMRGEIDRACSITFFHLNPSRPLHSSFLVGFSFVSYPPTPLSSLAVLMSGGGGC